MRIDLLLSRLCLFKTRSQAARACDEGRVFLNDRPAKAAAEVRPGDRIRWTDRFVRWEDAVEILSVPEGSVSRAAARDHYRMNDRRPLGGPWDAPWDASAPAAGEETSAGGEAGRP